MGNAVTVPFVASSTAILRSSAHTTRPPSADTAGVAVHVRRLEGPA